MPDVELPPPFEAYTGDDPYLFVSYAHHDAALVFPELVQLATDGYRVWYDEGIDPGNEWPDEVARALQNAAYFLVFVSSKAVQSRNVKNEINFALNNQKPLLAVHLEETALPSGLALRMGDIQAVLRYRMSPDVYRRKLTKVLPESLRSAGVDPVVTPGPEQRSPALVAPPIVTAPRVTEAPVSHSEESALDVQARLDKMIDPRDESANRPAVLTLIGTSSKRREPATAGDFVARNIAVTGQHAYVVAPREGVRVYSIVDEGHPSLVSAIHYPYDPIWFAAIGRLGILRAATAGVLIFDLSEPAKPAPIPFDNFHNCRFDNCGRAILNLGTIVIDLCWRPEAGVRFLDFEDPRAVRDLGRVHFGTFSADLYQHYLILASADEPEVKPVSVERTGIREMDTILLDTDEGLLVPKSIAVVGRYLYVVGVRKHSAVLVTYDLEGFPRSLRCVHEQHFHSINAVGGLQMTHSDRWLCLADGGHVTLIDLSNPDSPSIALRQDWSLQAATVTTDRVYASDARDVWIYQIGAAQ